MLRLKEANPLAVFNMRKLDFCPPHFQIVKFNLMCNAKDILNWIYENTEGRFSFIDGAIDNKGNIQIGFEIHSEATYMLMMLPQINVFPVFK